MVLRQCRHTPSNHHDEGEAEEDQGANEERVDLAHHQAELLELGLGAQKIIILTYMLKVLLYTLDIQHSKTK